MGLFDRGDLDSDAARTSSPSWLGVVEQQGQSWVHNGTGQAVDALECSCLGRAAAEEPGECVSEFLVGHESVGVVL